MLVCNELLLGRKDLEETNAYADPGENRAVEGEEKVKQEKNPRMCRKLLTQDFTYNIITQCDEL